MNYTILIVLYSGVLLLNKTTTSRILGVSVFPSYSHQIVFNPIWTELSKRGHEVVSITPNPIRDDSLINLTEIDISFSYKIWKDERNKWFLKNGKYKRNELANYYNILGMITEKTLQHPEIQDLLQNSNFDLVIVEWVFPGVYGFSTWFKCPMITVGSIDMFDTVRSDVGSPVNPAVYSNFFLSFTNTNMNFWQRLESIWNSFWLRFIYEFQVYPISDQIIRRYFGAATDVKEIMKNISVCLVNRNNVFYSPKLSMPNVVGFLGYMYKKLKALAISLGTNIKSHTLTTRFKKAIFGTFRRLPYRVIMSYDCFNVSHFADNVRVLSWVPQNEILGHKNIKVFITQGGLQSTEEAIRKRVPMIGIPFIMDQPRNVFRMVELGIGLYQDPNKIKIDSFTRAIIEVAENITYKKNIENVATILEDEPIPSIENVMWWIEYVLRHKGAPHLRSPYLNIPWYQIYWLDVISFISLPCIIVIVVVHVIFKQNHVQKKYE